MKTVYLVGPIKGCTYKGCTDWREYAIKELKKDNIQGISPMRAKNFLTDEDLINDAYDHVLSCGKGITTRDFYDVSTCDMILGNFLKAEKVSIGSILEYGAAHILRKPIITAMEKKGNVHEHAMVDEITGYRVESLDEALYVAKAFLSYK
jgi:hypothetical protein